MNATYCKKQELWFDSIFKHMISSQDRVLSLFWFSLVSATLRVAMVAGVNRVWVWACPAGKGGYFLAGEGNFGRDLGQKLHDWSKVCAGTSSSSKIKTSYL